MRRMFATLICLLAVAASAHAHELMVNRATVVARDDGHITLTLYLNSVELLHQTLAPAKPLPEFLVAYASMSAETLSSEMTRAEGLLERDTHIHLSTGEELNLVNWSWPPADKLGELIRQQLMMITVDPANHTHEEQIEVHVETAATDPAASLKMKLPESMGQVLVVWYHPKQAWLEAGEWTPDMMRQTGGSR